MFTFVNMIMIALAVGLNVIVWSNFSKTETRFAKALVVFMTVYSIVIAISLPAIDFMLAFYVIEGSLKSNMSLIILYGCYIAAIFIAAVYYIVSKRSSRNVGA